MKRRNPRFVHEHKNRHGTTVVYLRRPGYPKVRLRILEYVLPHSPAFMAIYDAAMAELPASPIIGASRTVPGTVNAALVSYYGSTAFDRALPALRHDPIFHFFVSGPCETFHQISPFGVDEGVDGEEIPGRW